MSAVIEKMRSDWAFLAPVRKKAGEWSDADEAEFLAAIKAAIASDDESLIACWARWLAELTATELLLMTVARGVEGRMRAAIAEAKAKGPA